MGTQLVLSSAKRLFFNLCNALNPKPNSQTIRILSPYRNISLFSLVFILGTAEREGFEPSEQLPVHRISSAARSTTPASFLIHRQSAKPIPHNSAQRPIADANVIKFVLHCSAEEHFFKIIWFSGVTLLSFRMSTAD